MKSFAPPIALLVLLCHCSFASQGKDSLSDQLFLAAIDGQVSAIQGLLKTGAQIDAEDECKETIEQLQHYLDLKLRESDAIEARAHTTILELKWNSPAHKLQSQFNSRPFARN